MSSSIQIENCDFKMEETRARRMSDDALRYSIADAKEALAIHEQMDREDIPNNAGKYADQIHIYSQILASRERKRNRKR